MTRILEPEVMDDPGEAACYADAAAQEHLDRLDSSFVDHALSLGATAGLALDVGTGPAQIPAKMLERAPGLRLVAVDRARAMLSGAATTRCQRALEHRLKLVEADGRRLPFPDGAFDLVVSNSLLHHLADPAPVLSEMRRVLKPGGALLASDLRRPLRLLFAPHVLWHGRNYRGLMFRLFRDSVKAAFTVAELEAIVAGLGWTGARVAARGSCHLFVEVRAAPAEVRAAPAAGCLGSDPDAIVGPGR